MVPVSSCASAGAVLQITSSVASVRQKEVRFMRRCVSHKTACDNDALLENSWRREAARRKKCGAPRLNLRRRIRSAEAFALLGVGVRTRIDRNHDVGAGSAGEHEPRSAVALQRGVALALS